MPRPALPAPGCNSLRAIGLIAALLALALAACARPAPVTPALWQVDGPHGERAWLFGTIHALPDPVDWRSQRVDAAMAEADRLVMEIAAIEDSKAIAAEFARLDATPGLPPLAERLPPEQRPQLAAVLARTGIPAGKLDGSESWAAALMLAQALQNLTGSDSGNGIDRAVARAMRGKRLGELEGAARQLALFDGLPESEQRQLLGHAISGDSDGAAETARLARGWSRGDMALLEAEAGRGMLADPELREALLTGRNRDWAGQLDTMLRGGGRPFVAVGAMHLAGPDGLPALLSARGWKVTRLQ